MAGKKESKKESKKRQREDAVAALAAAAAAEGGAKEGGGGQVAKRHRVRLRESEVFTRLQHFEHQIDEVLRLTRIEYNATRASPKTASLTPRIPKTLHLEVKTELRHAPDERTAPTLPKEWSLTLTGRLLDRVPTGGQPLPPCQREHAQKLTRMSDVVQRVVIKLDPDHEPAGTSCVEWTRPVAAAGANDNDARTQKLGHFDGLTVTRPVRDIRPFDVDILIELRFEPARFKLSAPLRRLLNIHTDTRQRVIKALYEHCKAQDMFDRATGAIYATPEIAAIFIPEAAAAAAAAAAAEAAPPQVELETAAERADAARRAASEAISAEGYQNAARQTKGNTGAAKKGRGKLKAGAPPRPILTWDQITEGLNFHLSAPDVLRLRHRVDLLPPPIGAMAQPHSPVQDPMCQVHSYKVDLDIDGTLQLARNSVRHWLLNSRPADVHRPDSGIPGATTVHQKGARNRRQA
eukprot:COSAG02_NODE_6340_length_3640_cov_1.447614_5_plen_464_part_00